MPHSVLHSLARTLHELKTLFLWGVWFQVSLSFSRPEIQGKLHSSILCQGGDMSPCWSLVAVGNKGGCFCQLCFWAKTLAELHMSLLQDSQDSTWESDIVFIEALSRNSMKIWKKSKDSRKQAHMEGNKMQTSTDENFNVLVLALSI